ncbi:hypothetical protein B4135_2514 [Caldibacillus debilis]|uniref:Uncharacterized protein n=1 Tax=Caldibacillus debilis TaxID=301148 RepID=A0A150LZW0_9BACI|nr:hypothetical protein B4135_2514 [Caldibacillus debilis]
MPSIYFTQCACSFSTVLSVHGAWQGSKGMAGKACGENDKMARVRLVF